MSSFQRLRQGAKNYLLIPVMPTPNGGLHLGHLAGPYLKMDVLARAQRRNGSEAAIFFGSDSYESYMNLKSWQIGRKEEDLCNEFHDRMKSDLDALEIKYDAFINSVDPFYKEDFIAFFKKAVEELRGNGLLELVPEKYQYSPDEDCYLAGCWILGNCPGCGSSTGSYQCEECGTQYRPMDLGDATFRKGDYPLKTIDSADLYLGINNKDRLLSHLQSMGIGDEFISIAKKYLNRQGEFVRITNPGKYGIEVKIEGDNVPHVVFTYTALYIYSLFCGELYKNKFNNEKNPFDKESGVITVASFGIDCSVPYMVAGLGLAIEPGKFRPFDYLLPNHFFTLENFKFSTSRVHAIWGNDLVNNTPVTSDAIRYFLCWKNPENAQSDFNVNDFLQFVNEELAGLFQETLMKAWDSLKWQPVQIVDDEIATRLESLLIDQLHCLTPPGFRLRDSCIPLRDWVLFGSKMQFNAESGYWWLKGFSLLAFPVMPACASTIWTLLGHEGTPKEKIYFQITNVELGKRLPLFFNAITFDDIKPALPATLFS